MGYSGGSLDSLIESAAINVDDIGVAYHHGVAVAVAGISQPDGDVLFRIRWSGYVGKKREIRQGRFGIYGR